MLAKTISREELIQQFYDDLAGQYHCIYESWDASMDRQASALSAVQFTEVLSNVVDGKRAHPAISGCLFHFTVDEWHPLDDLGDELVAPESVPVFLRIGGQFEYHGESGYT